MLEPQLKKNAGRMDPIAMISSKRNSKERRLE